MSTGGWTRGLVFVAAAWVSTPLVAAAQETADYFKRSCSSCHTIGGGALAGPDLKDVGKRAERAWLLEFLQNPQALIDRADPYAQKLVRESRGVVMPRVEGMSRDRAGSLLDLIDAESALPKSRFKGAEVSDRPFVPEDVARGRALFTGTTPLASGAAACTACHATGGLAGPGGGRLGPDLTDAFARLEGRKALATWLSAPATPVMGKVFASHPLEPEEVLSLVAFLEDAGKRREPADAADGLDFLVLGVGMAAGALVLFDVLWKWRFRAVREPLVNAPLGAKGESR